MNRLYDIIDEMVKSIDQMTELFYQQRTKAGYERLDGTLTSLMKALEAITQYKSEGNDFPVDVNDVNPVLNAAMKALKEKDTILFSDILQYELKEPLINIMNTLE